MGFITSLFGAQNQFSPQGAGMVNPFGSDTNAQVAAWDALTRSTDLTGTQSQAGQGLLGAGAGLGATGQGMTGAGQGLLTPAIDMWGTGAGAGLGAGMAGAQAGFAGAQPGIQAGLAGTDAARAAAAGAVQAAQPGVQVGLAGAGAGARAARGIGAGGAGLLGAGQGAFGAGAGGLQGTLGQGQGLIDLLSANARGQGPSPAQQQFKQNLDTAAAEQAGGVASTRGLNPALAARLAATGGAQMRQGAAGQAATLQAQEQLSAQGLLGQSLAQRAAAQTGMGQLGLGAAQTGGQLGLGAGQLNLGAGQLGIGAGQLGAQTALGAGGLGVAGGQLGLGAGGLGLQAGLGAGQLGLQTGLGVGGLGLGLGQLGLGQGQLGLGQQQVGLGQQQLGASLLSGAGQQNLTQQQILNAAMANMNAQRVGMQSNINQVGAGVAGQNAQINAGMLGGGLQGLGAGLGLFAHGGRVPQKMADGGDLQLSEPDLGGDGASAAMSRALSPGNLTPPTPVHATDLPTQLAEPTLGGPGVDRPFVQADEPKSGLGKALSQTAGGMAAGLEQAGAGSMSTLRSFMGPGQGAPGVISPWSFGATGGRVRKMADGGAATPQPTTPQAPPQGPQTSPDVAATARAVAEHLSKIDPRSAAIVYADLAGIPTTYQPHEVKTAYRHLALSHAALLAQQAAGTVQDMLPPGVTAGARAVVHGTPFREEMERVSPQSVTSPSVTGSRGLDRVMNALTPRGLTGTVGTGMVTSAPEAATLAAAGRRAGGFTFAPGARQHLTQGYALSTRPDLDRIQQDIGSKSLQKFLNQHERTFLHDPEAAAGAWHNPETGKWELDVSKVVPGLQDALRQAGAAKQKAIFDLGSKATIPVPGRARGGRTFARDGRVPGQAKVSGDSERNDVVPAMLSPGEIVVPRSQAQGPDAPEKAARFVAHLMARKRFGFGGIVDARRAR